MRVAMCGINYGPQFCMRCILQRIICIFKHFHSALGIIKSDCNCNNNNNKNKTSDSNCNNKQHATCNIYLLATSNATLTVTSNQTLTVEWQAKFTFPFLLFFGSGCVHTEMQLRRQQESERERERRVVRKRKLLTFKITQLTGRGLRHVARGMRQTWRT